MKKSERRQNMTRRMRRRLFSQANPKAEGILCVFASILGKDAEKEASRRCVKRKRYFDDFAPQRGQARKSARGMPWHWEPKKGVAIYEKPREAESKL